MESGSTPITDATEKLIYEACQLPFANNYNQEKLVYLKGLMDTVFKSNYIGNSAIPKKAIYLVKNHIEAVQRKRGNNPWLWFKKIFGLISKDEQFFNSRENLFLTSCDILTKFDSQEKISEHDEFLLDFYTDKNEYPKKLGFRSLANMTTEWPTIKACSETFFRYSGGDYAKYSRYMKDYFCGEHFLIADNGALANKLSEQPVAHLRSSSHYAFGSTDGLKGGKVPQSKEEAYKADVEPQYEITGDQAKVLLFSKVSLQTIKNKILNEELLLKDKQGKVKVITPNCVKNANTLGDSIRTYSWLQTEWAPDSANWREANFWKHRVFSFGLYVIRKLLKMERPNIGPYGYGHGDPNAGGVGPTILEPQNQGFGSVIKEDEDEKDHEKSSTLET